MHALEVDDHVTRLARQLGELAQELLGGAEEQRALHFEHGDFLPLPRQHFAFLRRAQAVRAHHVAAIEAPNHAFDIGAVVEGVQLELVGDLLADADAAHAVADGVDRRREHGEPDLPRNDGDDAPRHAALGRHADLVGPLPGIVVHAAGVHHGENVAHILRLEHGFAGDRVGPVIGQRGGHDGEIASRDVDRALAEIEIEHVVRSRLIMPVLSIM